MGFGPNGYDILAMPIGGDPYLLVGGPDDEAEGHLSPDGRWLAYHSDESGRFEVYVRPFPNVNDGRWSISTAGGQHPRWSPDGRELFYVIGSTMMRVPVETGGSRLVAGTPEPLFSGPFDVTYTSYAISPDGTYFIMVEVDPSARPTQIHVVLNWSEEVSQLAPAATP